MNLCLTHLFRSDSPGISCLGIFRIYLLQTCSNLLLACKTSPARFLKSTTPKYSVTSTPNFNSKMPQVLKCSNLSSRGTGSLPRGTDRLNKSSLPFSQLKMLFKVYRLGRKIHKWVSPLWFQERFQGTHRHGLH